MLAEIKVPSPGESVTNAELARWMVQDGAIVKKDQEIGEIESEKATLPLIAPESGQIHLLVEAGSTIPVGTVVATIDSSVQDKNQNEKHSKASERKEESFTAAATDDAGITQKVTAKESLLEPGESGKHKIVITPLARNKMEEYGLKPDEVTNRLHRITSRDVDKAFREKDESTARKINETERSEQRNRMNPLRKKLSERLVAVKNQTAMLTTFNEADMSSLIELRRLYQERFTEKYGVKPGYMAFFARAVTIALEEYPQIQAMIDGDELVIPNYCDLGIAVQTEKGLMVPIIRNAHLMNIPELENRIQTFAEKARSFKLSIEEMSGGTFTITNGGVFGSLFSTPLLNPPQSAILGMHSIVKRPVVINDQIAIRPMMYLALSYDHRVIDGKDSVGFLLKIKTLVENPHYMLTGGKNPDEVILGL